MNNVVGIYSDDYLLLLEFTYLLENELPDTEVKLFGKAEFLEGLPSETLEQISGDINGLLETDVAVILGKLPKTDIFPQKYDGTIIDLSDGNDYVYSDTIMLADPLFALLTEIAKPNENLVMNISMPAAVYGRAGVDQLMQETRSVYSFENYDDSTLPMRMAFNIHFYADLLPHKALEGSVELLRKYCDVNLRLNPVSTAFVVDITSPQAIPLPGGMNFFAPEGDFSLDDITSGGRIAAITTAGGRSHTLVGDYLHLKTATLLRAVKAALGV